MSGKKNQPRVKGNLKPTSSSRAADLLGGDMAAINAFKANPALAFSQFSRASPSASNGPSTPTTYTASPKGSSPASHSGASTPQKPATAAVAATATGASAALDQIDGQLASQLKRLGKQDSKTKMRALFELKTYVSEHSFESGLEGMLLAWPPLFKKYIFDPDRRVRAAVANVNAALVTKVGKRLATHLKQLVGPWVASYFDPHREVAKASRSAFERVFPESKRSEVYSYCLSELVEFAADNILNQTPETLSDPRFVDPEDMRSKYEHVIGASFGTLALAVEENVPSKLLEYKIQFDAIFGAKPALRFVSSQSSFIRRGCYRLIRIVMLRCPELVRDVHGAMAHALLSSCFKDSDPNAHGDMWDAVLLTTKNYPHVWLGDAASAPNAEQKRGKQQPLDRLLDFLRSRCHLAPTVSYPSMLALLANLPASVIDSASFQSEFENALWQGAANASGSADPKNEGAAAVRAVRQESVALVSAICECFSFLWTRSLKNASSTAAEGDIAGNEKAKEFVAKEASRETDRLWHFYLQNPESAEQMTQPVVKLYCKIENLSAKYDTSLLEKIWAQTGWFAQRRLSGDSIYPIVYLTTQLALLDPKSHRALVLCARRLLVDFCQLAVQSPDSAAAQSLIQTLTQLAPEIVFQEGFSTKFSMRLEGTGSSEEAIDLVLSKAQYLIETTGSAVDAAQSVDAFIASKLLRIGDKESADSIFRMISALLAALPASETTKSLKWNDAARLPSLGRGLLLHMPSLPDGPQEILASEIDAPSSDFVRLLGQALLTHFTSEADLIGQSIADSVFSWMETVFMTLYKVQWSHKCITASAYLASWTSATYEVLNSWTNLARDSVASPRFVRFWLSRSGNQANSALGLLFDFAISAAPEPKASSADDVIATLVSKLQPQSKRAWSAIESQIGKLNLGSELSRALADSISSDLGDLCVSKNPSHLARLAHSVYARICPQSDSKALKALVSDWILDERQWNRALNADSAVALGYEGQTARYLSLASTSSLLGLRKAIDAFSEDRLGVSSMSGSCHTLTRWSANAAGLQKAAAVSDTSKIFDIYGLSRFARRAIFAIEFVQLCGGTPTLSFAANDQLAAFIRNMTLAFILLNEALTIIRSYLDQDFSAEEEKEYAAPAGEHYLHKSKMALPYLSIVKVDSDNSAVLCAQIEATTGVIRDFVSDVLGISVVHGSALPRELSSDFGHQSSITGPRDPSRWLSALVTSLTNSGRAGKGNHENNQKDSVWEQVVNFCVSRAFDDAGSPWAMVLGNLMEWCLWAFPLDSVDIEAAVANPLSRRIAANAEPVSWTCLVTVVVRAVRLRQQCARSPALQSTLLDVVSQLSKSSDIADDGIQLVSQLELLCELLPAKRASLDASASTPKIVGILTGLCERLGNDENINLTVILAALATIERFALCAPAIDDEGAIGLARLCLRWISRDFGTKQQVLVATAASRAVSSLAQMTFNMVENSLEVVGPTMRQIGEQLVDRCVLSERPVAEGVHALTRLVRCGYFSIPAFTSLYPVLCSASPQLTIELMRLILSAKDISEYIGAHLVDLVRLVSVAAKALGDLSVPLEEFGEAVESDEYIRSAGLRLLSSMALVGRCADAIVVDAERHEEITDLLNQKQVLDSAMPWVCALLGLNGNSVSGGRGFNAKLWDIVYGFDWDTWATELALNPTGEQLFRVLAHHVLFSVAWAFPSTFRLWWAGLSQGSRATSVAVEQFVTKFVSPAIVENEMHRIRQQDGEDRGDEKEDYESHIGDCIGGEIEDGDCCGVSSKSLSKPTAIARVIEEYDESTVRAGASQVTLTYTIDDSTLEIAVRMPSTYPLTLPTFECAKRVAVSEKRWRGWLVSAQAQMSRNRRMDAVCAQLLGNIGAHFAGVEDCAICYSAVGTMDNTLPNKQCNACKKKFHRMCIFKWFNTSNQSTCPLCRNLF
ncbi:hypothetical protein LPJ64_001547 [Coemansia asiatica]|uniref:E3 ubiquitin-protein ligase listerin n=1 Tax=Coemansia asiatica TaxID=1052880 RepID=A0A9W7XPP1_9FUNG|nr:hypothetical protein LPJ64_001547 [Coemansia asiatica]